MAEKENKFLRIDFKFSFSSINSFASWKTIKSTLFGLFLNISFRCTSQNWKIPIAQKVMTLKLRLGATLAVFRVGRYSLHYVDALGGNSNATKGLWSQLRQKYNSCSFEKDPFHYPTTKIEKVISFLKRSVFFGTPGINYNLQKKKFFNRP